MKVATIVSTSLNTQLEVHVDLGKDSQTIVTMWNYPLSMALNISDAIEKDISKERLKKGEFAIFMGGSLRPVLKEIDEAKIFINTGRRFATYHKWHEIWALRPEHLTQLEKEYNHEARNQNQSEH